MNTTVERPVRRDPKSGHLLTHAAYEGWTPSAPKRSSWLLVAVGVALVALAIGAAKL